MAFANSRCCAPFPYVIEKPEDVLPTAWYGAHPSVPLGVNTAVVMYRCTSIRIFSVSYWFPIENSI